MTTTPDPTTTVRAQALRESKIPRLDPLPKTVFLPPGIREKFEALRSTGDPVDALFALGLVHRYSSPVSRTLLVDDAKPYVEAWFAAVPPGAWRILFLLCHARLDGLVERIHTPEHTPQETAQIAEDVSLWSALAAVTWRRGEYRLLTDMVRFVLQDNGALSWFTKIRSDPPTPDTVSPFLAAVVRFDVDPPWWIPQSIVRKVTHP